MPTTTTFRTRVVDGIYATLAAYASANPSQLSRAYRARPMGMVDLPFAFVDDRPESATHDSGVRTRTMSTSVVVVRAGGDNPEIAAAFDTLVDGLMDAFSAVPQFATGTIWSAVTVSGEEIPLGEVLYPAVRFSWPSITIMEGRD